MMPGDMCTIVTDLNNNSYCVFAFRMHPYLRHLQHDNPETFVPISINVPLLIVSVVSGWCLLLEGTVFGWRQLDGVAPLNTVFDDVTVGPC